MPNNLCIRATLLLCSALLVVAAARNDASRNRLVAQRVASYFPAAATCRISSALMIGFKTLGPANRGRSLKKTQDVRFHNICDLVLLRCVGDDRQAEIVHVLLWVRVEAVVAAHLPRRLLDHIGNILGTHVEWCESR